MNTQISDIEFSRLFEEPVGNDYETALDFITTKPDYSLLKFREIITAICLQVASCKNISFESNKLHDQIQSLYQAHAIDLNLRDMFHRTRILCNDGVHKTNLYAPDGDSTELIQELNDKLIRRAKRARDTLIAILRKAFPILYPDSESPQVELADIGAQEHRELLFNALNSPSQQDKFNAGLLLESLAESQTQGQGLVCSDSFYCHVQSIYQQAAINYEAAYKMSAHDRFNHWDTLANKKTTDEMVYELCDLEPLFRYALLACEDRLDEAEKQIGLEQLKIAADRGHVEAAAYYGAYQYNEDNKYDEVLEYLEKAAAHDDLLALRFLYFFYSEEKACEVDPNKALYNINRAIELGCMDSLAVFGQAHFEGRVVEKDAQKGNAILKEAQSKGSMAAENHFRSREMAKAMQKQAMKKYKEFEKVGHILKQAERTQALEQGSLPKKIGRNEPCPCESGKKYKKCCGK